MNLAKRLGASVVLGFIFIMIMPSRDSLWTDEAQTYRYAQQPDFASWRHELVNDHESEALMPLGVYLPWLTAKITGTSEWSLRAINILWTSLALVAVVLISQDLRLPWLSLLFVVQPYLWFYTNEARTYSLQIAEGSWLLLALIKCMSRGRLGLQWPWCLAVSGLLLCATTLLGIIPFLVAVAVISFDFVRNRKRPTRAFYLPLLTVSVPLLTLGAYYLWALHRGAQSAKLWSVSPGNIAFSFYELLGFSGLGPGRALLRGTASGAGSIIHELLPYLAGIAILAMLYCGLALGCFRVSHRPRLRARLYQSLALALLSTFGLAGLAAVAHFPFWGRHLAPIFPAVVVIVAISLDAIEIHPRAQNAVALVLCLTLFASSCELRFSSRHAKDDYRLAASHARGAMLSGKRVWWFADFWGGEYYGLPLTTTNADAVQMAIRPDKITSNYASLPPPDLIVLSKPEVYDTKFYLRNFMREAGYRQTGQAQAFTFFEK